MSNSSSQSTPLSLPRPMLMALYLVALAFIVPSLLEFLLVTLPYRFGTAQWRFGAVGLLFNSVLFSPIVGISLAALVSVLLGHRTVSRVIAVIAALVALFLVLAVPLFALDFLQLRALVNAQVKRPFDLTSLKATFTGLLMAVTALWVAVATWRSAGAETQRSSAKAPVARPKSTVVMGSTPQAPQA